MKRLVLLVLLTSVMLYSEQSQWQASEINLHDIKLYRYVIMVGGEEKEFYSSRSDVSKILEEEKLYLDQKDYVIIGYEDDTYYIEIVRCYEEFVTLVEEIPFTIEYKNSMELMKGSTEILEEGRPGFKEVTYRVVIEKGKEKYRELYSEFIVKSPKPKIILKGQRTKAVLASREPTHAKRILTMNVSAYTHTGNRTFTGIYPEVGTIAVDPKVIPLGTRLWVEGYGYGIAQDTGKAIKGNKLDLFMNSKRECLSWGRRKVKVYVLPD